VVLGPNDAWRIEENGVTAIPEVMSRNYRDTAVGPDGSLWVATRMGLYQLGSEGLKHYYEAEDLVSKLVNGIAFAPNGQLWAGGYGGVTVLKDGNCVQQMTGESSPPHHIINSMTCAPDGTLWAGTDLGVARWSGGPHWSLRHSKRWLLSDQVRDVAFDANGTAWIATSAGVSAIKKRTMTLAEKAEHYYQVCMERHVRPPGLVEKCWFPDPADHSVWEGRDDDNDGQYTSLYLVMEAFRYAVTKDPDAKAKADKTFAALEFLRNVTETKGFVARTVVPAEWRAMADANEDYSVEKNADRMIGDPRWKAVGKRWRLSADEKWFWKGDTSSDEIVGHMFAYYFYYELVADDAQKEGLRNHVRAIMDHIIDNGYVLRDPETGESTRWGVWAPEILNGEPDWLVEKHINSFEMLSFLRVAHHITGDAKYEGEYHRLIDEHGYAETARRPKAKGLSEGTRIDDYLLVLSAPGLLFTEKDPALLAKYMEGIHWAYKDVENDENPFFNYTYALLGEEDFHNDESVAFLRDQPLDLVHWLVDSSRRDDLNLQRSPMLVPLQTDRMLPPSERGVMRWDKQPWEVISGDFADPAGHRESSGVFWLLPYWMGRYYGYIEAPKVIERSALGRAEKFTILVDKVMQPEAGWVTEEWMIRATAEAGFNVYSPRHGYNDMPAVRQVTEWCQKYGIYHMPWMRGTLTAPEGAEADGKRVVWANGNEQALWSVHSDEFWEWTNQYVIEYAKISAENRHLNAVFLDYENYAPRREVDLYELSYEDCILEKFADAQGVTLPKLAFDQRKDWLENQGLHDKFDAFQVKQWRERCRILREAVDAFDPTFQFCMYPAPGSRFMLEAAYPEWGTVAAPIILADASTYGRPSRFNTEEEALNRNRDKLAERRKVAEQSGVPIIYTGGIDPVVQGADAEFSGKNAVMISEATDGYWIFYEGPSYTQPDHAAYWKWFTWANRAIADGDYAQQHIPREAPEDWDLPIFENVTTPLPTVFPAQTDADGDLPPLKMRRENIVLLQATQHQAIEFTLENYPFADYTSPLVWEIRDDANNKILSGRIPHGQSETIQFTPEKTGIYLLGASAGACAYAVLRPNVPIALHTNPQLTLFYGVKRLHFEVPEGVDTFTIKAQGQSRETMRMNIYDAAGQTAATGQTNFTSDKTEIVVQRGQHAPGLWSLEITQADEGLLEDNSFTLDPQLPPVVYPRGTK
jgi:hypothetical protein